MSMLRGDTLLGKALVDSRLKCNVFCANSSIEKRRRCDAKIHSFKPR